MKVKFIEFYGYEPIKPIAVEKYYIDDKMDVKTRQMTYELAYYTDYPEVKGLMYPTFEINDIIISKHRKGEKYLILRVERGFNEWFVERLDSNLKRTGETTYFDTSELVHYLKDVEIIYGN